MLNGSNSQKKELYDRSWMIKARILLNLSQRQAAEEVGVSQGYYSKIENGFQTPDIRIGLTIAKVLGMSPDVWLNEKRIA